MVRANQEAQQMRFGQLLVTLTFDVRNGRLTRVHPRYEQRQAISLEDIKSVDTTAELA